MCDKPNDGDSRRLIPTKTPGVYRRGSRYVVRYRDPQGKQRQRAARTLSEARRIRSEVSADIQRGEYRAESKMTFVEYATEWVETYTGRTSRGFREESRDEYRRDLRRATAFFGSRRLAEIDPPMVKQYAFTLSMQGLEQRTVTRILAPVKALFATAVEDGLIRHNPTTGVRLTAGMKAGKKRVKVLTPQELAAVIQAVPPTELLLVRLLAQTGLRIGEACALRWQDVDTAAGTVEVHQRVRKGKMGEPKSDSGFRVVPIGPDLAHDLKVHRMASPHSTPEAYVFATKAGLPADPDNRRREFKKGAKKAGVPWAAFHTLRHTAASMWLSSGRFNIAQVARMLGHHDPSVTLSTYIHVMPHDLPSGEAVAAAVGVG